MTNEEITTKVEKAEHDITILKDDVHDIYRSLEAVAAALNRISDQQEKFMRVQTEMQVSQARTEAGLARTEAGLARTEAGLARTEEIVEKLAAKQFEYEERQARADERQARTDEHQARDRERIAALEEGHNRVSKSLDHLTQTVDRYIASRNNGSNGQP